MSNPVGDREIVYDAWERSEFLLQCCELHQHLQYPPGPRCRQCGGAIGSWKKATGEGTVLASSVVYRAPSPEFQELVPYVVAILQLEEGPLVETWIDEEIGPQSSDPEGLIGRAALLEFKRIRGRMLPVARLHSGTTVPLRSNDE